MRKIRFCRECKDVELVTSKSKILGKCKRCRDKTMLELGRRIQWEKLLENAKLVTNEKDRRRMILGVIKGRKNFLKCGDLGGTIEREFGFETFRDMNMGKKIIKSTEENF